MPRKKVKFALVANENSRAVNLKKKKTGLVKKVRELTILCDVKACLIMFNPNEVEPMVWPSVEVARALIRNFTALPDFMKKKKETTLESYLREKTWRVQENLKKIQKENVEYTIDQLMVQISSNRKLADLHLNEIYSLLSFSKEAIMHLRKSLDPIQHSPLPDPPVYPFAAQVEEFRTTTNDVFVIGGGQENERAKKTYEELKRVSIGSVRENQSYYLMDEWFFPSFKPPYPQIHLHNVMNVASANENLDPRCYRSYHPYQGSSSNGNHHLEMEPICPPVSAFHDLAGPVSQPFQHHLNMNHIPTMALNQSKHYPFDFMRCEERSNINKSSNAMTTNDGLHKEPPPPANGVTTEEGNAGAKSFDVNMDWLGMNNHHF